MSFLPEDSLLLEETEIAKDIHLVISYVTASDERVVGYTYLLPEDFPDNFVIEATSESVTLTAKDLSGFFKPRELKLKNFKTGETLYLEKWSEVAKGWNVVSFRPPIEVKRYEIMITCEYVIIDELTQMESPPIFEDKTYQIVISPHYSRGKMELENYVTSSGEIG